MPLSWPLQYNAAMKIRFFTLALGMLLFAACTQPETTPTQITTLAPMATATSMPTPGPTATPTATPRPTPLSTETATASAFPEPLPTSTPEPLRIDLTVDTSIDKVVTGCRRPEQQVTGVVTLTAKASDEARAGRIEFSVDGTLQETAESLPFEYAWDTTVYDDGSQHILTAVLYDQAGVPAARESRSLFVNNTMAPTLKTLAEDLKIEWGSVVTPWSMDDGQHLESFCKNFNLIVPDGMFMRRVEPSRGAWNFSHMDRIVEFAQANNIRIRGQPLVWGRGLDFWDPRTDWVPTPLWVHNGDFSREEMIGIMYGYIEAVINRYKDRVKEWVVVNEPLGGFGELEVLIKNVWSQGIGDDYVELAFRHAHEIDPDAILILNDARADYLDHTLPWRRARADNFYNYVARLVKEDVPIDAVGFQFHLEIGRDNPTVESIVSNFTRYHDLGLVVYISELDIRIEEPVTPEDLQEQARLYGIVMQAVLESDAVDSILVWGFTDRYSWLSSRFPGFGAATLFDDQIRPKPAYNTVIEVMKSHLGQ